MALALSLIAGGGATMLACHAWWRNPDDHLTRTLPFFGAAASSLFDKKGTRA